MNQSLTAFSPEDIRETQPAMKIGLLATVTPEGLPHVTLLSSLMACAPSGLCFGQFTEGMSKKHILDNPKGAITIGGDSTDGAGYMVQGDFVIEEEERNPSVIARYLSTNSSRLSGFLGPPFRSSALTDLVNLRPSFI